MTDRPCDPAVPADAHEAFAGDPVDDGWQELTAVPGELLPPVPDSAYGQDAVPLEEVPDGELDPGSVPGQPQD